MVEQGGILVCWFDSNLVTPFFQQQKPKEEFNMDAVRFRINGNGAEVMVSGKWQENTNLLATGIQGMKTGLLPGVAPRGSQVVPKRYLGRNPHNPQRTRHKVA